MEEATLGGLPAYCASYTAAIDSNTLSGTACSLLNTETSSAVVLQLETLGDEQMNESVATVLDATLKFFKPI